MAQEEDEAHSPILEMVNSPSNEPSSTSSSTPSVSMKTVVPEEVSEATLTSIKTKTGKTKVLGGVTFDTVPLSDAPDSTRSNDQEVKPETPEQGRSGICGATFNFGKHSKAGDINLID